MIALMTVVVCGTTVLANNTLPQEETPFFHPSKNETEIKKAVEPNKPECTVTASASYTGSGSCNGNPYTATSNKTASCSGIYCAAAFTCASIAAYFAAVADVNSIMELCNNP